MLTLCSFNGWGVSVFDSLDTMWIMGLYELFEEGLEVVSKATFDVDVGEYAPFFETIIRYLGGLLSAYALSGEPVLLDKANQLGASLLPAFQTPSGFPMYAVNPQTCVFPCTSLSFFEVPHQRCNPRRMDGRGSLV